MSDVILNFRAQGLEEMASDTAKATQELTELSAAEKQVDGSAKSLRTTLKDMREELGRLALAGQQNTEQYKKLRDEAGRLKDTIADVSEELTTAGSDTSGLDKALRATNVLLGGFTAVQGAAALFGDESEDLQKTLLKVNAAMSILNGLQAVQGELAKKDSIFTTAATRAKVLYAAAVGSATGATKAFRIALLGIVGVGIAAVITAIAVAYNKLTKSTADAAKLQREVADASQAELTSLNELLLTARDETANRERRNDAIKQINQSYPEYLSNLSLENINTEKTNNAITKQIQLILLREKAQILAKRAAEAQIKLDDIIAKGPSFIQGVLQATIGVDGYTNSIIKQQKEVDKLTAAYTSVLSELNKLPTATNAAVTSQEKLNKEVKETVTLSVTLAGELGKLLGDKQGGNIFRRAADGFTQLKDRVNALRQAMADANKEAGGGGGRAEGRGMSAEEMLAEQQKVLSKRISIADLVANTAKSAADFILGITQQNTQKEIDLLEEKRKKGLVTEKEYQKQLADIKNKAAKKQRAADLVNAGFQVVQSVLAAFAESKGGISVKIAAAAIAAAFAGAQFAALAASPLPKYRGGVIDLKGPGTATSDSIVARLSKGESVMTAQETVNHRDALTAMRKNDFDKKYIPIANMSAFVQKAIPTYYPSAGAKAVTSGGANANEIIKLQDELKFIGQYIRQGNNIAATSQQHLRDIKTTKRVIYT